MPTPPSSTTIIQHKRLTNANAVPSPSDLVVAELAVNSVDGKLFTKNESGEVIELGGSGFARLNKVQTFVKPQACGTLVLTSGASWDGTMSQHLTVNVSGSSFIIANPSSQVPSAMYCVYVTYSTSHSISWGSMFKGLTGVIASATAGAVDTFFFRSNGSIFVNVGVTLNGGA